MIQIIANIDEKDLKGVIEYADDIGEWIGFAENIVNSVFTGEKLPKGHGRLIDADKLCIDIEWSDIENAPTIVQADKEIKITKK